MRLKNIKIFLPFITLIIMCSTLLAQFGKNKVIYDEFSWQYIQTEHFDIYYYEGGEELARFAAPIMEEQMDHMEGILHWKPKKRTSFLIYNSHADFQQTNVTLQYLSEGIGGFTELFKNRAVVAFTGDYHEFWHVVRHELLHVYVNDMIYGGNVQSIISGRVRINIPLWMNEGLAEYVSWDWDSHADLVLRDIAMGNTIPNIELLDYYLAYKGGQSVYTFLVERYGEEKIGELWKKIKSRKNVQKAFESAIGMDMKELSKEWHKWLRKQYWPEVSGREELSQFAIPLTDHVKLKNYFNTAPSISPNGEKVAFMSNRNGYADIYLASVRHPEYPERVVRGTNSPDLEEVKWLNPRLNFSPDGKKIVLATKSGANDALIFVDVETGKHNTKEFSELNEIFSAAWSPDGHRIAFIGLKDYRTDLYVYDINTDQLEQLTDDIFYIMEPSWSPDGKKIVFASQRGRAGDETAFTKNRDISKIDYHEFDLFYFETETGEIVRLTDTPWDENSPIFMNTKPEIIYSSDEGGISNLFVLNYNTLDSRPITNVLTGAFQPSISKDDMRLVFAGYANQGWDIYTLSDPFSRVEDFLKIEPVAFYKKSLNEAEQLPIVAAADTVVEKRTVTQRVETQTNFSSYVFAPGYDEWEESNTSPDDDYVADTDTTEFKTDDGDFVVNDYKTKFSLDYVDNYASYSTYWGLQGSTVFSFSDVLGNHRLYLGTEMYIDLENSDYILGYQYLTKRTNYSFYGFHNANLLNYYYYYIRYRNYGADVSISHPVSKFTRGEVGATWYNLERKIIDIYSSTAIDSLTLRYETISPRLSWVYDNTLWTYFYPVSGWRYRLDVTGSPKYNDRGLSFVTLNMDLRRYVMLNREYSLAFRLSSGISFGPNAQRFFMGGESNWINYRYKTNFNYRDAEEIYFSHFVTPVRGARYYEQQGTRYALANLEFRYPFIKYLQLGWPLPITMGGLYGVTFLDLGTAWYEGDLNLFTSTSQGYKMDDLIGGYGFGTRLYLGYILLKIDVAWKFDGITTTKPRYYFSLGTDF